MAESSPKAGPLLFVLLIALAAIPATMAWVGALGLAIARDAPLLPAGSVAFMALLLPALAMAGSLDDRRAGFAAGIFFWGVVVLASMPMFFPGERAQAMSWGWAWLQGEDEPVELAPWAERVDGMLPGQGEQPELIPVVEALDTGEPAPPVATSGRRSDDRGSVELQSDEVVLPYRPDDNSLVIPVELEGPDGTVLSTHMTYDTGATLTTVDSATLHILGIAIPRSSPVIELRTASGVRTARLVLLDRVWLGGFEIPGVTVSVCDECKSETSVGLLGLNATGRFRVVVDQRAEALVLRPRADQPDQLDDVEPWIQLSGRVQRRSDGNMIVELDLVNNSRRDVDRAIVHVRCGKSWPVEVDGIPAGGQASARVILDGLPECDAYGLELERAWW